MTYHQTIIVGNIGKLDQQFLQNGTAVCRMSVAVNEYWNDRNTNERREKVTWYRVSVWGKQGETAYKYLEKGRQVMVTGTMDEPHAWVDDNGNPHASNQMTAKEVKFLSSGAGQADSNGTPDNVTHAEFTKGAGKLPPPDDDSIPF